MTYHKSNCLLEAIKAYVKSKLDREIRILIDKAFNGDSFSGVAKKIEKTYV